MKRMLVWLLVLAMLCGCNSKDVPTSNIDASPAEPSGSTTIPSAPDSGPASMPENSTTDPNTDPVPVPPAEPPGQELPPAVLIPAREIITYTVERDICSTNITTEDGVELARVIYRLPRLQAIGAAGEIVTEGINPERSRALEIMAAFNANFDPWRQEDQSLRQMVMEDYTYRSDAFKMGMYYADELDFSHWQTEKLISIRADSYSYYGGAHPNTVMFGWNFDLESGTYLNALAISHDEAEFRTLVAEELVRMADERAVSLQQEPDSLYWADYRNILANWSDYPVIFDETGMTVRYSAYELGSYAAGPHEFTLCYEFLQPHLGDYGRMLLGLPPAA